MGSETRRGNGGGEERDRSGGGAGQEGRWSEAGVEVAGFPNIWVLPTIFNNLY